MKRKITALLVLSIVIFILSGCYGKDELSLDIDALADEALSAAEFKDEIVELDDSVLANIYSGLQIEDVAGYKVFVSSTSSKAEEIALFEAKSQECAQRVLEAVNERIDDLKFGFDGYLPEELKVIEDAVIKNEGKYVLFAVGKNYEKINDVFDKFLNK